MPFDLYTLTLTANAATGTAALSLRFSAKLFLEAGFVLSFSGVEAIVAEDTLFDLAPTSLPIVGLSTPLIKNAVAVATLDDNARIRNHLGMNLNSRTVVASQMSLVERDTPSSVAAIQSVLAALDGLRLGLSGFAQDAANTALIKAGSLEWAQGGRTMSIDSYRVELRRELANYLDLSVGGGGHAVLRRS